MGSPLKFFAISLPLFEPVAYRTRTKWKIYIHFMKYGNLTETNFICVITKLSPIPFSNCRLFISCLLLMFFFSLLVGCFYPKVYFIACTEHGTYTPTNLYFAKFASIFFLCIFVYEISVGLCVCTVDASLQNLRWDKMVLAPDFNGNNGLLRMHCTHSIEQQQRRSYR